MRLACIALLLCLVAPTAAAAAATIAATPAAGDPVPSGFNLETVPAAGPLAAVLPDGTLLVRTGVFGEDELSVLHEDGSATLFADGFGSIAGIAVSPLTGTIVVGDSFFSPSLRLLRDLNKDGDAEDDGEDLPLDAALPPLANGLQPLPFDMGFFPGTDSLYVSGSTTFTSPPVFGAIVRVDDATGPAPSASLWADGLSLASGMLWSDGALYCADLDNGTFVGRVIRLEDGNADGDALDAGETTEFAAGLSGASDIVQAADGFFYLSGTFDDFFGGAITRLAPDGDDDGMASDEILEQYFTGFAFAETLTLLEGPGGFLPGAAGDGLLYVSDFTVTGNRTVRSAPHAELSLSGEVANNSVFTMTVAGAPGAKALLALSLDTSGVTFPGIGDLCLGFGAPHLILGAGTIDGSGETSLTLSLHDVPGAVGLPLVIQGFTLEGGDVGISQGIDTVIAP